MGIWALTERSEMMCKDLRTEERRAFENGRELFGQDFPLSCGRGAFGSHNIGGCTDCNSGLRAGCGWNDAVKACIDSLQHDLDGWKGKEDV